MKRTIPMSKGIKPALRLANRLLSDKTLYLSHDYETMLFTISDINPQKPHTIVINEPQPIYRYIKIK